MVAKKISELVPISTLATDDVIPITDISAGTDGTKTVSIGSLDGRYLWGQTEAEAGAGVTPVDKQYPVGNVKRYGAVGDGIVNDTQAIVDAMESNAGGTVIFPDGNYATDHVTPLSNTTIWMDGGVTITRILQKTFALQIANVSDVHFYCNGATIDGSNASATATHTVNFVGAIRCTVRDAYIKGAGQNGKDGVYFGQGATTECFDCGVIGGRVEDSLRNGVSFVAAVRCFLDGVEIYGATGAPGRGVDVEANNHDEQCVDNIIRNCHVHDNQKAGIGVSFGDRTKILNNKAHDNGDRGISVSSGGNTRNPDFYRNNVDVMGISNFDQATGLITVGGDLDLIPIGLAVSCSPKNGESNPVGLTTGALVVAEHGASNDIRVGSAIEQAVITSFSGAETGTTNADPDLSDYILNVFGLDSQSAASLIENNVVYDNTGHGIDITNVWHTIVSNNYVYNNTERQIFIRNSYNTQVIGNNVRTDTPVLFDGITLNKCSYSKVHDNHVYKAGYVGLNVQAGSYSSVMHNKLQNCGDLGSGVESALLRIDQGSGLYVGGNVGRNSEDYGTTSYGMYAQNIDDCHIIENSFKNGGPDNPNSIVISGTDNYLFNNVQYDGTPNEVFSKTYDPPNLVDGAGVLTAVTVENAAFGDFVQVSFSLDLLGIQLTGYVTASNAVTVRFQNETGGAVDLASGTLRVRVMKAT